MADFVPAQVVAVDAEYKFAPEVQAQLSATFVDRSSSAVQPIAPGVGGDRGLQLTRAGIVVRKSPPGSFDSGLVESPCVQFDDTNQQYVMVHTAYNDGLTVASVGLATAAKPEGPWVKQGQIFGASGVPGAADEAGTTGPYLYREGGVWHLFYIGLNATGYEGGDKSIMLATTTDPDLKTATWTRHGAVITKADAGTGWRNRYVWHPCIIKRHDTYYMFFNATGDVNGINVRERIGYATAPGLAGPWSPDDMNSPILDIGGVGSGRWDAERVGDPSVYRIGNTWYMAYYGYGADGHSADGVAWTSDDAFPLGWSRSNHPVLAPGPAGTFDDSASAKPYIYVTPDRHYHYYTAAGNQEGTNIALAVSPGGYNSAIIPSRFAAAIATTSTSFVAVSSSEVALDTSDKPGLMMRIGIRANPNGDTITVRDNAANTLAQVSVSGPSGWVNAYSNWVSFNQASPFYTRPDFKSGAGASVQLGSVFYEFRWFAG